MFIERMSPKLASAGSLRLTVSGGDHCRLIYSTENTLRHICILLVPDDDDRRHWNPENLRCRCVAKNRKTQVFRSTSRLGRDSPRHESHPGSL